MKKRTNNFVYGIVIPFSDKQGAMDGDRPHESRTEYRELGQ